EVVARHNAGRDQGPAQGAGVVRLRQQRPQQWRGSGRRCTLRVVCELAKEPVVNVGGDERSQRIRRREARDEMAVVRVTNPGDPPLPRLRRRWVVVARRDGILVLSVEKTRQPAVAGSIVLGAGDAGAVTTSDDADV